MKYDEFLELFEEAQKRRATLNLISENMGNVYEALQIHGPYDRVFTKPKIQMY